MAHTFAHLSGYLVVQVKERAPDGAFKGVVVCGCSP